MRMFLSILFSILAASFCVADEEVCHAGDCSSVVDASFVQVGVAIHSKKAVQDPATAAEITGVSQNAAGDLTILIVACIMNGVICFVFMLITSVLRNHYPKILCNNSLIKAVKDNPPADWFSWVWATLEKGRAEQVESCTLDAAMLIEYTVFCMRLCAWIATPALFIAGPLCYFTGHGEAEAVGDNLSMIGINNVRPGHPYIYKVYGVLTIYVVVVTHKEVMRSMKTFQKFRVEYLERMKDPQASVVMVEGIPEDYQSEERVRNYFSEMFSPDVVDEVYMVQYIPELEAAYASWKAAKLSFGKAEAIQKTATDAKKEDTSKEADAVKEEKKKVDAAVLQVQKLRKDAVLRAKTRIGDPNGHTAFVKFKSRSEVRIALSMQFAKDSDEWCISQPAEPDAIIWSDLKVPEERKGVQKIIGYVLVFLLYMSFTPFCVWVTNISSAINLGPLQPVWEVYAPTLGLLIFLSFVPTVLIQIFSLLFAYKTDLKVQHQLQVWYFWFLVFFVILVTVVGSDFAGFFAKVAENPLAFPLVLADRMPSTTHYYLNYLSAQWFTHGMNLSRYLQVTKFVGFRQIYEDEDARKMSEPEDQDYYGMGSRSARFTSTLLIAIIFGILSPLMGWIAFVNFFICRMFYGYLLVYAEGRKADSGGEFFVTQLEHTYCGILIFVLLMIGIFTVRAPSKIPLVCAWTSLFITAWSWRRFHKQEWEVLPWADMKRHKAEHEKTKQTYAQPALVEKLD
jgi:hypothetical protein